jgi:O-antigen chain-terminating methyltransferase
MAAREDVERRLSTEIGTREGLTQALNAEISAREELSRGLSDEMRAREALANRLDAEISALEWVTSAHNAETAAREALAGRVDSEIQAREDLSRDLSAAVNRANVSQAEFRQSGIRVEQLRAEVINQSRRVSILLEEARKRLPKPFDQEQLTTLAQEDKHALDAVYVSFEDRFRGTREEIKDRCRVYLPFLHGQNIGSAEMPILDVGCGRGEWLELLKGANLKARGIDTNRVLLADCTEKGFDVVEDDVLHHLRSLPDASIGAVTGFHIIEHLPLDVLIKVFDETVRVLKPGGLAIFETPNPQNVLVGSHNFYLDLTHRNPLPSLTIQFLLEARGLCDVQVLNLHPYPESAKVVEDGSDVARRFNEYFYRSQDYAVVGRRA